MSGRISSDHSRSASRSSQTPRLSQGQAFDSTFRHSFGRTSRISNPNVFSDEYSLEPIDTSHIDRSPSPASTASSTTLRSIHSPQKNTNTETTENENPFGDDARVSVDEARRSSLPQKGLGFYTNRNSVSSINNGSHSMERNQSISSRFSMPRALSPYTGATGPSHPYAMYPQVGVSRSPSVGSAATIRQHDRPLGDSTGPQHPYAMYPQNVVEEGIDDDVIPVGFPGHNSAYDPPPARRDEEVGDIIGLDGHTEPLPPYSRYPTGVVPKPPNTTVAVADESQLAEDQQLHSLSREPPVSETSSRALVSENSGNDDDGDANRTRRAVPLTGIMAFEEKLKRRGKQTACCGLPVWTFVLIVTVLLIGGCIGGVIGGVLGTKKAAAADRKAHEPHDPPIVTVTATPQLDYSTMTSTPANLKTVPTGHYLLPEVLQNSSRFCVADSEFRQSWNCMNKPNNFEVYVGGSDGQHSIVFTNEPPTSTFTYGAQQPFLSQPTQSLSMAMDTSEASMGPALFFWALFNKLVIVPEDTFSSSSVSARSFGEDIVSSYFSRKETAQPGERPWFCWWNSTVMEFFIYVNESTSSTSYGATATTDGHTTGSTATSNAQSKRDDLTDYPRKIKIEERRDYAGAQAPYCQQMQVMDNGQIQELSNERINIKEIEPTPTTTYMNTASGSDQTYTAKAQFATPCYCLSFTE